MRPTRRQFVASAAGVGAATLAGCTSGSTDTTQTRTNETEPADEAAVSRAQTSFFVFYDAALAVAGDTLSVEYLIPFGQHGHGWSPDASVRADIREADVLVHGPENFQPWIDDILVDLSDTTTINIASDVELLDAGPLPKRTYDPHFWMDPIRMQTAVETVQQRLAEVDPDNATTYEENAQARQDQLQTLHEDLTALTDRANNEVLLHAGHNAFRYLAGRYGFDVFALTGVSPDDRPTTEVIQEASQLIQEHDLSYVCADPIEKQFGAQQLVAETDAQEVLDLTAMPGVIDTWQENDWGYLEIMRNVNMPTLERALDA